MGVLWPWGRILLCMYGDLHPVVGLSYVHYGFIGQRSTLIALIYIYIFIYKRHKKREFSYFIVRNIVYAGGEENLFFPCVIINLPSPPFFPPQERKYSSNRKKKIRRKKKKAKSRPSLYFKLMS